MNILEYTRNRSVELADYLEECAQAPLEFISNDPLRHSSANHVHLWLLERYSDCNDWVNLEYKIEFFQYILEVWKNRIKGLPPYQTQGYRFYVYTDLAPTISVVAETNVGFPYRSTLNHAVFVNSVADIVAKYENRKWADNFSGQWDIAPDKLIQVIHSNKGSIGKPTAQKLGVKVGELRHLIINMDLANKVNDIRKKYKRRPADFSNSITENYKTYFYEARLPPKFK